MSRRILARPRARHLVAGLVLAGCLVPIASASGAGTITCLQRMTGGTWSTYGQSLSGQQHQRAERVIGVGNVAGLAEAWRSDTTVVQSAPPIIAGGCVFLNTNSAIEARELRTGRLVWRSHGIDTGGTFAPTVVDGRVHLAIVKDGAARAVALDQRTGRQLWMSKPIWFGYPTGQQSSAIVYDGIQLVFTTGPDNDPQAKQGYALVDARTGRILHASLTLPKSDRDKGLVGGGVWGTPTVDTRTGYAYVGTSNPESKRGESRYDDSIIKLDLNRDHRTFGRIVATYKGTPDSVTGYDNPVCQTVGGDAYVNTGTYGGSPTCGQIDVDFGVGPTLWRNSKGRLMGAATQKSGVLHVFYGDTMKGAWSKQLFVTMSFLGGNIARIATDGRTLYVVANPGVLYAFDAETGATRWQVPLVSPIPMEGGDVVLANGILYFVGDGQAHAYDARDGSVLWDSPVIPGASIGSAGALAGHYYVANHYGTVVAYRLPGQH
ncbi:MAG TPA: PQQ-binding-like beta-propeller repeat protein [Mycobacteriales bacterium]|nr:PQQ-binding-like beta-propeller repeat protein [Mycobacteriales bacterium]